MEKLRLPAALHDLAITLLGVAVAAEEDVERALLHLLGAPPPSLQELLPAGTVGRFQRMLRRSGIATRSDLDALRQRIEVIEERLGAAALTARRGPLPYPPR